MERLDAFVVAVTLTTNARSAVATVLVDTGCMPTTVSSFSVRPQQKVTPITAIHIYTQSNYVSRHLKFFRGLGCVNNNSWQDFPGDHDADRGIFKQALYLCPRLRNDLYYTHPQTNPQTCMVWYGMVWYGIVEFNVPLDTV